MKREIHQGAFPVTRIVVVMAAFFSMLFLANANHSIAAPSAKTSPAVERLSAVDHAEARIKELQGSLKITGVQEKLWNNLTQVMRENAKEMDALTKDMRENSKTMNAVEHMKYHSQIMEAHLSEVKKFIPPFEELYTSMSDEQKKSADTIFQKGVMEKHKKK